MKWDGCHWWSALRRLATGVREMDTGEWGEAQAEQYLKRKGLKILGRRVRYGPREELDLVAREGDHLIFVEVKTRKSEAFGRPADSVNQRKRELISRGAVRYMAKLRFPQVYVRFDVIEVVGKMEDGVPTIRHIPNAFTLDPRYRLPM